MRKIMRKMKKSMRMWTERLWKSHWMTGFLLKRTRRKLAEHGLLETECLRQLPVSIRIEMRKKSVVEVEECHRRFLQDYWRQAGGRPRTWVEDSSSLRSMVVVDLEKRPEEGRLVEILAGNDNKHTFSELIAQFRVEREYCARCKSRRASIRRRISYHNRRQSSHVFRPEVRSIPI